MEGGVEIAQGGVRELLGISCSKLHTSLFERFPEPFFNKVRNGQPGECGAGFELFVLSGVSALPEQVRTAQLLDGDMGVRFLIGPIASQADFTFFQRLLIVAMLTWPAFCPVRRAAKQHNVVRGHNVGFTSRLVGNPIIDLQGRFRRLSLPASFQGKRSSGIHTSLSERP